MHSSLLGNSVVLDRDRTGDVNRGPVATPLEALRPGLIPILPIQVIVGVVDERNTCRVNPSESEMALVEQHVLDAEIHVARQLELLNRLPELGAPAEQAEQVLTTFEDQLVLHRQHFARYFRPAEASLRMRKPVA